MIYCPHCRRPAARASGDCPHCGRELAAEAGKDASSAENAGEAAPEALSRPVSKGSGLDLESVPPPVSKGSGLDLESAPPSIALKPLPEAVRASAATATDLAIAEAAGFGKPRPGIFGAVAYWVRVRRRLRVIAGELAAAESSRDNAFAERTSLAAELGRTAHSLGVSSSKTASLISEAMSRENVLRQKESRIEDLRSAHADRTARLEAEISTQESAAAPIRETKENLVLKKKKLDTQKRGFETEKKRCLIDLENTEALLGKKRDELEKKDEDEKDAIVRDMDEFESRRRSLWEKIASLDASLSELNVPAEAVQLELLGVEAELLPYDEKCAALRNEIDGLNARFAETERKENEAARVESEQVSRAWAEAGFQVVEDDLEHPDLEAGKVAVQKAARHAAEAESQTALWAAAADEYDRRVARIGLRTVIATACGIALLLIALIFFI